MNMEQKLQMRKVVQMLSYMTAEIQNNMARYILVSTNEKDKYAIKHTINPNLTIEFAIYNTENSTLAYKEYTYEEFAGLCSDVIVMEDTFKRLADDLIEAVSKPSSIPIKLNNNRLI